MTTIRVWSPGAERADLVLGESSREMTPASGGHFEIDVEHGTDYLISVDGREARPDPRSAWQPYGVHDASRAFDTGMHEWHDSDWRGVDVRGAVAYELHIGTFTPEGTLDSAISLTAAGTLDEIFDSTSTPPIESKKKGKKARKEHVGE